MGKSDDFSFHLANWLTRFLPGERGLAPGTILSYRDTFRLLLRYYDERLSIAPGKVGLMDITAENISSFLDWLESTRNVSVSTRNQRLAAINSFCRYVQHMSPECIYELSRIVAIPNKKHHAPARAFLGAGDIRLLLAQPNPQTPSGFRDQVLLSVLYDTAARVSEIIEIRIGDVRLDLPATVTLHGKGNKTRVVPIMAKTAELLSVYLAKRIYNPGIAVADNVLFENQKHQKMTRWGIQYILDKHVKAARQTEEFLSKEHITPHLIRHSRAAHLLQAGVNLIYIRDLLGHVDVSTTEIYARADTEMKRKALEDAYESLTPEPFLCWNDDESLMSWLDSII